jgi:indole-3-glycerol phosphate synthase
MTTKNLTPQLNTIIAAKRYYLSRRKLKTPIEAVRALASMQKRPSPILSTVTGDDESVVLIGQIKHWLGPNGSMVYDPVGSALRFVHKAVDAVALFTDQIIYENGLDDLMFVSKAIDKPVISQDYVLDEYEVVEARAAGASALMLSASILDNATLRRMISATQRNLMTAIVQVHNADELRYAISLSPHVICISSDNPFTPEIELELEMTRRMRDMIPSHIRVMIDENLKSLDDVATIASLDVDAVMVTEPLIDAADGIDNLLRVFKDANRHD